jgi:hypothetical protein
MNERKPFGTLLQWPNLKYAYYASVLMELAYEIH